MIGVGGAGYSTGPPYPYHAWAASQPIRIRANFSRSFAPSAARGNNAFKDDFVPVTPLESVTRLSSDTIF